MVVVDGSGTGHRGDEARSSLSLAHRGRGQEDGAAGPRRSSFPRSMQAAVGVATGSWWLRIMVDLAAVSWWRPSGAAADEHGRRPGMTAAAATPVEEKKRDPRG